MNSARWMFIWFMVAVTGLLPLSAAWADIQAVETKLTADDAAASDRFGNAVAVSGNYAVVGAQYDGQYLINGFFYAAPGAAYVFKLENGVWTQVQKLTDPDSPTGNFGRSVAISGEYIIVGSTKAAYIFKLAGGTWTQQTKITPPDGPDGSEFGYPLALSGEYTVIGAPKTPSQTDDEDAVYIFKREGDTWTQQQKLISSDSSGQSAFGDSFALSGETIALAEYTENTDGSQSIYAIVFKQQNGVWTEQAKLPVSDTADTIIHPPSLALSGEYMFAGDSTDADLGNRSGAVYVFKEENGIWTKEAKLTASDGAAQDYFGASVSADGDLLVVGKPSNNAHIYKLENGTWNEKSKLYSGQDPAALGSPVAISGNYALAGASNDAENGYGSGAAYVYQLTDTDAQCTVTIKSDLSFEFPNAVYQSPTGDQHLWVSFKYLGEFNGKLHWILTYVGAPDLSSCTVSIGSDLGLDISDALYDSPAFGKQPVWAEFEYIGTQNGLLTWEITGAGGK